MKHSRRDTTGFTLIELLIVMGIMVAFVAIASPITLDFYRGYTLSGERDTVLALFREARNQALIHAGNASHGLKIASASYTLFQGTSYAARDSSQDQSFPRGSGITINGLSEIVFTALSGRTTSSSFNFTDGIKTFSVTVNTEGMMDWTF